jgi:hypothetical protein
MQVGWIGLGAMGAPMAARLARCGHSVYGYDIAADRAAALTADGVRGAATIAAAVGGADVVAIMVATLARWSRSYSRLTADRQDVRPASVPLPGPGGEPVMPGTARDDRPDVGDDTVADDVVGVIAVHGARRIPGHQRHRVTHRQR